MKQIKGGIILAQMWGSRNINKSINPIHDIPFLKEETISFSSERISLI